MKFTIDGIMSNGDGLFSFLHYDVTKMTKVIKNHKAFMIMNLFILRFLEESYFSNKVQKEIVISYWHLMPNMDFEIKIKDFEKNLLFLEELDLIKAEKIPMNNFWRIKFI